MEDAGNPRNGQTSSEEMFLLLTALASSTAHIPPPNPNPISLFLIKTTLPELWMGNTASRLCWGRDSPSLHPSLLSWARFPGRGGRVG